MFTRVIISTFLLLSILIVSCSDDDNPVSGTVSDDTTAPATVTDLSASEPGGTSVVLTWTAPGDDGMLAKARQYDIRYSTSVIDSGNWESATSIPDEPAPTVGGETQSDTVTGLQSNTVYYFAIRTADEVPNWSEISNVVSMATHLAGSWTVFTTGEGELPSNDITDIAIESGAGTYVTTSAGLAYFDGADWTVYDTAGSDIVSDDLATIVIDGDGVKWIGSRGDGISKLEGSSFTTYNEDNTGRYINAVRDIAIANNGEVWVGTSGGGLFQFDGVVWVNFNSSNSDLFINIIGSLAFDGNGDLWIGYNPGGASFFDRSTFEHFGSADGFTSSGVASIFVHMADVWFGTDNGAFVYDGSGWTPYYATDSGLVSDVVLSVAVDNSGDVWMGTIAGVTRFDGTGWVTYNSANSSLPDNVVQAIAIDENDNVWLGTQGGLAMFHD